MTTTYGRDLFLRLAGSGGGGGLGPRGGPRERWNNGGGRIGLRREGEGGREGGGPERDGIMMTVAEYMYMRREREM